MNACFVQNCVVIKRHIIICGVECPVKDGPVVMRCPSVMPWGAISKQVSKVLFFSRLTTLGVGATDILRVNYALPLFRVLLEDSLQQNGASLNRLNGAKTYLNKNCPNNWTESGILVARPARFPDLTACHFLLSVRIRLKIYSILKASVEGLRYVKAIKTV